MSLMETQQIMRDLQEIMVMLNGVTTKTEKIAADIPKIRETEISLKQQVKIIDTTLMALQTATGNKTIDGGLQKVQQLIMLFMRLRMVMLAMSAASGPWGLAYAAANIGAFSIMSLNTLGQ